MLFVDIILVAIVALIAIVVLTALSHLILGAPYVPSHKSVIAEMIRLAHLKPGDTVVDLGAGDARLLIAAKKQQPEILAIGYEASPMIWLLGSWKIWRSHTDVSLKLQQAQHADLNHVDVVFLYLFPEVVKKIMPRMKRDMRPGGRVVSAAFPLDMKAEEVVSVKRDVDVISVYAYRWGDDATAIV